MTTKPWTDAEIRDLDYEYCLQAIHPYHRAMKAIIDLGNKYAFSFQISPIASSNEQLAELVRKDYIRLFPHVSKPLPGLGHGIVAALESVKKVSVGVPFGIDTLFLPHQLGFASYQDLQEWCYKKEHIVREVSAACYDVLSFHNAFAKLKAELVEDSEEDLAWSAVAANLNFIADGLSSAGDPEAAKCNIQLMIEMAFKALLYRYGYTGKEWLSRSPNGLARGQDLAWLHEEVMQLNLHPTDTAIATVLACLDDFLHGRFQDGNLRRLQIIKLVLSAQAIVANLAVRALRDQPVVIEASPHPADWPACLFDEAPRQTA